MPTSSDTRLAIQAIKLRKEYRLGEMTDIRRVIAGAIGRRPDRNMLTVLDDISFELEVGECLGILGPNGSGKSTMVQIIAGIGVPTGGLVRVRGRVLPLLEVGAVFNDELTGEENVRLFGTILGLSQTEIEDAMPEIAAFGGIDPDHMNTPLKRHSTGMRARLSFAVAMRFPADLYIFDEVIAVVDDQFRQLALQEIRGLLAAGRTVIFISHDLGLVRQLCTRALWLDRGDMRAFGDVAGICDRYAESQALEPEEAH